MNTTTTHLDDELLLRYLDGLLTKEEGIALSERVLDEPGLARRALEMALDEPLLAKVIVQAHAARDEKKGASAPREIRRAAPHRSTTWKR
ncbi:MAG: hypothetical protein HY716_02950 [Planctomycetes bacterium]|nr:hypothetical protein [Planctomycetota bacterium]